MRHSQWRQATWGPRFLRGSRVVEDAEELSLLRTTQERGILEMTLQDQGAAARERPAVARGAARGAQERPDAGGALPEALERRAVRVRDRAGRLDERRAGGLHHIERHEHRLCYGVRHAAVSREPDSSRKPIRLRLLERQHPPRWDRLVATNPLGDPPALPGRQPKFDISGILKAEPPS
jgi:hypothetical protein